VARGRRAQPDELKALKGNPGKRRLPSSARRAVRGSAPSAVSIMPGFLTQEREKELFTRVIDEYLQRRIARPSDANAYARYCSWLHRWWTCKESLDGKTTWYESNSLHGKLARRHPLFKDMIDIERVLESLEDRLGLNVVSRQGIVRGLAAMPAALGGLFGDEPNPADNPLPGDTVPPVAEDRTPSPIGIGRLN
jgi:P27 family predicted phage terminase small subunit